jgi:hydantoinase/carbamoylase family amidase
LEELVVELAQFGRVGPTAVTRLAFTAEDEAAHEYVAQRMRELGLQTRFDAFGNVFGRRAGEEEDAPVVLTGSHLDGPPDGGMFDGTIGVLCALEAIRILNERGVQTLNPIEVIAIRCEHVDRFGLSCLGSRALSGKLEEADLDHLKDGLAPDQGSARSLRQVLIDAGYLGEPLETVRLGGGIKAFVELHIEQGRVLEDMKERLGLVTVIAGPTRGYLRLYGAADHSGGTPMRLRRDALCGAAEAVLELERLASATDSCVGTVGIVDARPGALHTIPGDVSLGVDIRGVEAEAKRALVAEFVDRVNQISAERNLELELSFTVDEAPVPCSEHVRAVMAQALRDEALRAVEMPSGGGHDAQHLASCTEIGMLFVPSIAGISHTPDEQTSWSDLAHGAMALACCLQRLAMHEPLRSAAR